MRCSNSQESAGSCHVGQTSTCSTGIVFQSETVRVCGGCLIKIRSQVIPEARSIICAIHIHDYYDYFTY